MSNERGGQFTLRDLLVATAIVAVVSCLPANCIFQQRGGGGRRNTCQSNQHNISLALIQYAEMKRHYPGYANPLGRLMTTYVLPILPYMEKNDIYSVWTKVDGSQPPPEGMVYMSILICPSNPPQQDSSSTAPNSYIINAGQSDLPDNAPAALIEAGGIATDLTLPNPVLISQDYIAAHDGTACTLLTSENLQAGSWAETDPAKLYGSTTFLWWNRPPTSPQNYTRDHRINQGKTPATPRRSLIYCRPSSNHPGGVVVSFCGGNVRFIAEDIDYDVYKQLMTPNGAASGDDANIDIADSDF